MMSSAARCVAAMLFAIGVPFMAAGWNLPQKERDELQVLLGGNILWIGAHPDDEALIAPVLGDLCGRARCTLLVATAGERGQCLLTGGCQQLGALRVTEMRSAAAYLGAQVIQWALPDAMDNVVSAWNQGDIVVALKSVIEAERPSAIITFDPRHGSTCHPAHRLIGTLVRVAVNQLPDHPPALYFLETRATLTDHYAFADAMPGTSMRINAQRTWHYLVRDAEIHATQFSRSTIHALAATPLRERAVYLVAAASASPEGNTRCP